MKPLLRCVVCGREVHPWPLRRPGGCSPGGWAYCIRQADDPKVEWVTVYTATPE